MPLDSPDFDLKQVPIPYTFFEDIIEVVFEGYYQGLNMNKQTLVQRHIDHF